MEPNDFDIIVLGAGLTGLSVALELKKKHPERTICILEKAAGPGGLLKSSQIAGNWVDHGTFFFNDEFSPNLISTFPELFKEVRSNKHRVWYGDGFGSFPIDMARIFKHFSAGEFTSFATGFLLRTLFRPVYTGRQASDAEDWLCQRVTRPFYEKSGLREYISKLEGIAPTDVSYLFGAERLHRVDEYTKMREVLKLVARKAFKLNAKGKYDSLKVMHPGTGGVSRICEMLAARAIAAGVEIRYNTPATHISKQDAVFTVKNGAQVYTCGLVVNTTPLNVFSGLLKDGFADAPDVDLQYRDLLLHFIKTTHPDVTGDVPVHYSYAPSHRWKRFVSFSAILPEMAEPGTSSICVETTLRSGERPDPEAYEDELKKNLCDELGSIPRDKIASIDSVVSENAYPVFKTGYDGELQKMLAFVDSVDGLHTVGRSGMFTQDNTSDCISKAAAYVSWKHSEKC